MRVKLYITLCLIGLLTGSSVLAQQPEPDSTQSNEKVNESDSLKSPITHQLRLGFDIGRILFNNLFPSRQGYEIKADYNWNENLYFAAEAGWGQGKVDYDFLKYKTSGSFLRLGINKNLLGLLSPKDFDNAFIGVRYGVGFGDRGRAQFSVPSPFGGNSVDTYPGSNYFVHWGEILAGVTVGLWQNFYAGWTVRGKFLFNPGTFKDISPNYLPGFGKGDKKTVFDFNFYLSYGLQWGKKN